EESGKSQRTRNRKLLCRDKRLSKSNFRTIMRKRYANHRRVKIHRSYTVEEIARLCGNHKNTVRAWVKAGLPTCDLKRPTLILGRDLAAFLQDRRAKGKQPCRPGEIYCVRCRSPKTAAGNLVDYEPVSDKIGHLTASCPDCEGCGITTVRTRRRSEMGTG